mmetsp:Transcript_29434/g.62455  ORF Transcript_29434/g.62455 Transcript_29434/m.62455 type:complete len:721 (+) Transcript_29434:2074-4236(+)
MRRAAGESNEVSLIKDRHDEANVRAVRGPAVGVVVHDDVPFLENFTSLFHDLADAPDVARNGPALQWGGLLGLGQLVSVGTHEGRAKVPALPDDARVGHALELVAHLDGDVLQLAANDGRGDGVKGVGRGGVRPILLAEGGRVDFDAPVGEVSEGAAWGHEGGGVLLANDGGALEVLVHGEGPPVVNRRLKLLHLPADAEHRGAGLEAALLLALRVGGLLNLLRGAHGTQLDVHQLDVAVLEAMAKLHLVLLVELRPDRLQGLLCDFTVWELDSQLVSLAHVAQVARAGEGRVLPRNAVLGELRHQLLLHILEISVDLGNVAVVVRLKLRPRGVVFQIRNKEAHGREQAGVRRDKHLVDLQHARHLSGLHGTSASKGHQSILSWVNSLLDGTGAHGVGHVGIGDGDNALGALLHGEVELLGEIRHGDARGLGIERHLSSQKVVRHEPSQDNVRVRHGGLCAAARVAGGARNGPGRAGADLERSARVLVGDRAAARANGMDVDLGDHQRVARNLSLSRVGHLVLAASDDADVGTGASHVEGDQVVRAGEVADPLGAENAGRGAREDGQDWLLIDHQGSARTAVGRHHVQITVDASILEAGLELVDVVGDLGADVGVDEGGGEALKLPEHGRDAGRGGDKGLWVLLPDDFGGPLLVLWVEVAEEEADRDGVHALLLKLLGRCPDALFIQRFDHFARGWRHPLLDGHPVPPLHQHAVLPRYFL